MDMKKRSREKPKIEFKPMKKDTFALGPVHPLKSSIIEKRQIFLKAFLAVIL
jgi:hypothetical protein